ncbi:hypothetical protein D9756_008551 [Leucocoprinus leucothites]|uniref:Uncharacterized protein n=1 Tax=Leucocoprinus leucothites TaxID=201217 RepID=A0A8H5D0W2_9AGAR|nr:hypothetical protein D9756_008551 [Leucoagaricus leucothites]
MAPPLEVVRFITATAVEAALYGFSLALYLFCARSLYLQLKCRDRRKRALRIFMLLHMSLVMICVLLGLVVDVLNIQTSYVDHANYPGGGFAYSVNVFGVLPIASIGYVMGVIIDILTFGIQIWRLWIIWNASQYRILVMVVPILSLLVFIAIELAQIILIYFPENLTILLTKFLYFGYGSFELFITASVTIFIVIRIALVRRRHVDLMGQSDATKQYTSIISVLVESFALESLWIVISTLTFIEIEDPTMRVSGVDEFFASHSAFHQDPCLSPCCISSHHGTGWKEDTEQKLTTLEWNRDEPQNSSRLSDIVTRASLPVHHEEA